MSSEVTSHGDIVSNNKITSQGDVIIGGNKIANYYFQSINQPEIISEIPPSSLPPSAWTRFSEIDIKYKALYEQLSCLIRKGEYEQAINCYWQILYFTGTRERWQHRTILTKKLLDLSREEKDDKVTGQILAKGRAWPLIYTGNYDQARVILEDALEYFRKDNKYSEAGICYEYMADIFEQKGRLDLALDYYKEAKKRYKDIDEELVELKRRFVIAKHEDKKSGSRIVALLFLIEEFSKIKTYKEALAEIELAKSLYMLEDNDEALNRAQHAYHLLNDKIIMPRNAIKAKEVLCTIVEGKQTNI